MNASHPIGAIELQLERMISPRSKRGCRQIIWRPGGKIQWRGREKERLPSVSQGDFLRMNPRRLECLQTIIGVVGWLATSRQRRIYEPVRRSQIGLIFFYAAEICHFHHEDRAQLVLSSPKCNKLVCRTTPLGIVPLACCHCWKLDLLFIPVSPLAFSFLFSFLSICSVLFSCPAPPPPLASLNIMVAGLYPGA